MRHLKPFFPSSSPTPVDSTHSCSLQFNKPWYNIEGEKKKKNIPGAQDVLHLKPRLNVIKKTPLLRGGGGVAVCGGDGGGGGGHVVVLAAVVFIVVMCQGGCVLRR